MAIGVEMSFSAPPSLRTMRAVLPHMALQLTILQGIASRLTRY